MTVELNVFHTSSQPSIMDDREEVNMIDVSVNHIFEKYCYEDPLEKCLAHFEKNFDIDESIGGQRIVRLCSYHGHQSMETQGRTLVCVNIYICSINHQPPKLELKSRVPFAK